VASAPPSFGRSIATPTPRRSIAIISSEIAVTNRADSARYEITVDGDLVGFVTYRLQPGVITFRHAEIDSAREGDGLGSRLVADALDDARARGLAVRPLCPFVAFFIETHPEYADLVAAGDSRPPAT
jgi:predicted GNAT family acetyltransferase